MARWQALEADFKNLNDKSDWHGEKNWFRILPEGNRWKYLNSNLYKYKTPSKLYSTNWFILAWKLSLFQSLKCTGICPFSANPSQSNLPFPEPPFLPLLWLFPRQFAPMAYLNCASSFLHHIRFFPFSISILAFPFQIPKIPSKVEASFVFLCSHLFHSSAKWLIKAETP